MSGKRKKHQYLISGGKIPRRTEYRLRKSLETREAQLLHSSAAQTDTNSSRNSEEESDSRPAIDEEPKSFQLLSNEGVKFSEDYSCDSSSSANETEIVNVTPSNTLKSLSCIGSESPSEDTDNDLDSIRIDDKSSTVSEESDCNYLIHQCRISDVEDVEEDVEEEISAVCAEFQAESDFSETLNFTTGSTADNRHNKGLLLNDKLCSCSSSTKGDALLYCLALGIRHNLSWVAMVDILKMINTLYGYEAISASKYYLHKYFDLQRSAKYHLYCPACETYLGEKNSLNVTYSCECSNSEDNLESGNVDSRNPEPKSFFVSVDLAEQLKSVMEREELANDILTYRFQRTKISDDAYEDIFDGEIYKKLCENEETLGNPYNFSYTFNTDGVHLGKSTRNAAWPIFISINELSPKNRKKNMIFCGGVGRQNSAEYANISKTVCR